MVINGAHKHIHTQARVATTFHNSTNGWVLPGVLDDKCPAGCAPEEKKKITILEVKREFKRSRMRLRLSSHPPQ